MRRVARCAGVLATVVSAALLTLAVASPAAGAPQDDNADQSAGSTGSGYVTEVSVVLTGNAAPSGGGGSSLRVPVTCYWASQGMDAVEYKAWYENYKTAQYGAGFGSSSLVWSHMPSQQTVDDAVARQQAGTPLMWYAYDCTGLNLTDKMDAFREAGICGQCFYDLHGVQQPFPTSTGPPPPLVDPEDLARSARDVMVIGTPEFQRNPDGQGVVNLPTWFWTDPANVAEDRIIRAEVEGSGVWAEVVARTGGMTVSATGGPRTWCTPTQATLAYDTGSTAASQPSRNACTLTFARASVVGPYAVTASTEWSATWTGSGGVGGGLDPLARQSAPVPVPVGEIQTLVSRG